MNRLIILIFFILIIISTLSAAAEPLEWPREINVPEGTIVIYQPQLESFKDDKLAWRAAVSITRAGETEPVFGAVFAKLRVDTDREERILTPIELTVTSVRFPDISPESAKQLTEILEREIPNWDLTLSLDRVLAMLDLVETQRQASEDFNNKPPRIIVADHPAVLVSIDGEPELTIMEDSTLMRVRNTPFFIALYPPSKQYFLKGGAFWFTSDTVLGTWKQTTDIPEEIIAAADKTFEPAEEDPPKSPVEETVPEIIVTSEPAELVLTDGKPVLKAIQDTGLLFVSNTKSDLFMQISSQDYYLLLSGRWFSSKTLKGPWTYVPSDALPEDFRLIPRESEKNHVLASVAGTEEAKEAVLDTYIPETQAVPVDAKLKTTVTYDGEPIFEPVKGTPLSYAVNTAFSVILLKDTYYLCHEAIWYCSITPKGPWTVCKSVPKEVYTIPPDNPNYNTTYVRVYDATPSYIYYGYYPGYMGCYIYRGTVVYGTGYIYPGWHGHYYYPRPVTWGFSVHYSPYAGGWVVRPGYPAPGFWIAPPLFWSVAHIAWWDYRWHRYHRHHYRPPYRPPHRPPGYRPPGNRPPGGKPPGVKPPGKPGVKPPADKPGGKPQPAQLPANPQKPSSPGNKAVKPPENTKGKIGPQKPQNNVYADPSGNVYRKTNQGWEQRSNNKWSTPSGNIDTNRSRDLNRQQQARDRGAARQNRFQQQPSQMRRSSPGNMGRTMPSGGGSRGGGKR